MNLLRLCSYLGLSLVQSLVQLGIVFRLNNINLILLSYIDLMLIYSLKALKRLAILLEILLV